MCTATSIQKRPQVCALLTKRQVADIMDFRDAERGQYYSLGDRGMTSSRNEPLDLPPFPVPEPSNKAVSELRKVLSLIIKGLRERERPPSVFAQLASDADKKPATRVDAMVAGIKDAVRLTSSPKSDAYPDSENEDEDISDGYTTDVTLELMTQLRHTLLVARKHRWELLPSK